MIKPLKKLDIVISIYNQENLIRKVLYGIFANTTTPFNLILIFDGCTDKTKEKSLNYIKKYKPKLLNELIIREAPNVYETKANNIGFKLAKEDFMITVQDDMVIKEKGWERRLTYPLRKFEDVLAVTARSAHDIKKINATTEDYINIAADERGTLPRNVFAVRDIINRGPIAFRMDYLRRLNYLDEKFSPTFLDDADLSLRAWNQHNWKVGSFWIKYISPHEWGKTRNKDSSISMNQAYPRNAQKINDLYFEYINSGQKHSQDIKIEENEIDYIQFSEPLKKILHYPFADTLWGLKVRKTAFQHKIKLFVKKIIGYKNS